MSELSILKMANWACRYYKQRILEGGFDIKQYQAGYAIATKLLDMVENEDSDIGWVEHLRSYAKEFEGTGVGSAWMDLVYTIDRYHMELLHKKSNDTEN